MACMVYSADRNLRMVSIIQESRPPQYKLNNDEELKMIYFQDDKLQFPKQRAPKTRQQFFNLPK